MVYTTDNDLLAVRQDIMSLGVSAWTAHHAEAAALVDRALDVGWYRPAAAARGLDWQAVPFDGARLLAAAAQVKRVAVCHVLHLAYRFLARGSDSDVFGRLADHYLEAAGRELQAVLAAGLDYDWDASGAIAPGERDACPLPRRIVRQ